MLVVVTTLMTLAGVADASSLPRDEPMDEGWMPAARRQRVDSPSQTAGFTVGRLRIPAIGVDEVIRAGVAVEVLDTGPAYWTGTALPGEAGNMVVAAHRTTHGAPFHDLHLLEPGDLVYVTDATGFDVMYRVVDTFVVTPEAVWITWDNGNPFLTLFACHPLGSASQRIVVRSQLVAGRLIA